MKILSLACAAPLALALASLAACAGANANEPQNPNPADESHRGNVGEVAEGGPIYVGRCAKCHGPTGRGTDDGPPVVGEGALPMNPGPKAKLRKSQFVTAQDVFDFIKANMPKDKPGSMTDDDYYAVLSFDLKLNGVDLHGRKVDPTTAPTIRLPGR